MVLGQSLGKGPPRDPVIGSRVHYTDRVNAWEHLEGVNISHFLRSVRAMPGMPFACLPLGTGLAYGTILAV